MKRYSENLGAVDTEVFSGLLRKILAQDTAGPLRSWKTLSFRAWEMGQFVTDFIWYLRNLLLIATSDNAEEAVDASAETLARMKEESQMADAETLMRYIRNFFLSFPTDKIRVPEAGTGGDCAD